MLWLQIYIFVGQLVLRSHKMRENLKNHSSIITPTSKNLIFVVTLSPRSKCADKQKVAGVTTNYLLSRVITLLSRAQSIDFQLVILKV